MIPSTTGIFTMVATLGTYLVAAQRKLTRRREAPTRRSDGWLDARTMVGHRTYCCVVPGAKYDAYDLVCTRHLLVTSIYIYLVPGICLSVWTAAVDQ